MVRKIIITIELKPQSDFNFGHCELLAYCLDRGFHKEERLRLTWNVRSQFQVSPARAYFGFFNKNDSLLTRKITITRIDEKPLRIQKVENPCSAIAYTISDGLKPNQKEIVLNLNSRAVNSWALSGDLVIVSDNYIQPKIKIPFSGFLSFSINKEKK